MFCESIKSVPVPAWIYLTVINSPYAASNILGPPIHQSRRKWQKMLEVILPIFVTLVQLIMFVNVRGMRLKFFQGVWVLYEHILF